MAGIVWLTCPECNFRFYVVDTDAGKGYEWFCPHCRKEFPERDGRPTVSAGG